MFTIVFSYQLVIFFQIVHFHPIYVTSCNNIGSYSHLLLQTLSLSPPSLSLSLYLSLSRFR